MQFECRAPLSVIACGLPCGGSRWMESSIDRILHTRYATRLAGDLSAPYPRTELSRTEFATFRNDADGQQTRSNHSASLPTSDSRTCSRRDRPCAVSPMSLL
jgi:hypothetical protein